MLTLLVMAAGLGSRYGGLKQLDPVGPAGETVLDYSVFDAVRAGFGRVVFVIRREIEARFRALARRYEGRVPFACVFQELDGWPPVIAVAPERRKPWGTVHAVLCASRTLHSPFVVVNADDFYGARPYLALADFLQDAISESREHAMVPYRLADTLSEHGPVARGLCEVAGGWLARVEELTAIERTSGGIAARIPSGLRPLQREALVSMNVWGFTPSVFEPLDRQFGAFLAARGSHPTAELSLPEAVNAMVAAGEARVRVLEPAESWFGVTYRADVASLSERIRALVARGDYPSPLWGPA